MATDATGTPTNPDNIPKYNTAADIPSGKGLNAIVDAIQTIISQLKAGTLASGKIALAGLATTGTANSSTFLRGDGAWAAAPSADGWIAAGETWTYASADDPTYTFTAPGDLTGKYAAGQRIKLTQTTGGTKYFIVTVVSHAAGTTTITVYGGTDYDLANEAISSPYYSREKAPVGFPLSPRKWSVESFVTVNSTQAAAVAETWYNTGAASLVVPIGAWRLSYYASIYCDSDDNAASDVYGTLSTANNSASDSEFNTHGRVIGNASGVDAAGFPAWREKFVELAAKTTYYVNIRTDNGGSSIWVLGAYSSTNIRATCAYL